MSDPSNAVQKAIYQALNNVITINGSPGTLVPVYDQVPASPTYPYVTIDAQIASATDFLSSRKDDRFVYLNVWSTYKGSKEVWDIIAEIDRLLHQRRLPLETGTMVRASVIRKGSSREPGNETRMGRVTVKVITQH